MEATNMIFFPDCIPEDTLMMQEMVINRSCHEAITQKLSAYVGVSTRFIPVPRQDAIRNTVEGYGGELLAFCRISSDALSMKLKEAYAQAVAYNLAKFAEQSLPGKFKDQPECYRVTVWVCSDNPEYLSVLCRLENHDGLWAEFWERGMDRYAKSNA